jgi:hypothetical protein
MANAFGLSGDSQRLFKATKGSALTEFDQCQRLGHSKDGCMKKLREAKKTFKPQ